MDDFINFLKNIVVKQKTQSIIILVITLAAGYKLITIKDCIYHLAEFIGALVIIVGLLYTFVSFFTNQTKENYENIINQYKSLVNMLKTQNKKQYNNMEKGIDTSNKIEEVSGYKKIEEEEGTESAVEN